jgi:hypothetical protein
MRNRPLSVTIVSWIFIVLGAGALVGSFLPKTPEVQKQLSEFSALHPFGVVLMYVGFLMGIICGAFMLRGANWARWLFLAWFGYNTIENFIRSPVRNLPAVLLMGIAVYLLFRPEATAYFRGTIPKIEDK